MSHTSVTDSLREITENIYDLPEYKIKMEIVEHHVDAEGTISAQEYLDSVQDFQTSPKSNEPCFIKEEVSEKNMKHSDNKEMFSCPHCNQTFRTKTSYKVHILCSCEPKDLKIIKYKCALCKETFTSKDSFEAHLRTHRSQKSSDINDQFTSSSGGDSQPVLFLSAELHQGEDTTDHARPLAAHQTDGPSPKEPKLDDMQPTTAAVRSPTEDPAAANTSTHTMIETEANFDKADNFGVITKKKYGKNLKLKGAKIISKGKMKKVSTKDTATMLKLSGTNTDDKTSCAVAIQAKCISNTVIGTTGDIHTCDICGYTTTTENSLNSHMKAHSARKRYSCDSCLYLTIWSNNFNKHVRIHTGEKPYSCVVCEKQFSSKQKLNLHSRTHTGEKPYSCDICENKFRRRQHLVMHMRRHTGEKPHSCDVCQKKFIQKSHLDIHLRTHTGEKPYSCVVCEKQFSSKQKLNLHSRKHTGEKPYSCVECRKQFTDKSCLVKHLRTHTGEKPYSCNMCEWKFSQKVHLVRHARKVHS